MSEPRFTPGPWRWEICPKHKSITLSGGVPRYDLSVMQFERWGMQGAQPLFRETDKRGLNITHPVMHWSAACPGREHHEDWFRLLKHPDAQLIEVAPDLYDALQDARQYVVGAYKCAFPDDAENQRVLKTIDTALAKARGESEATQ